MHYAPGRYRTIQGKDYESCGSGEPTSETAGESWWFIAPYTVEFDAVGAAPLEMFVGTVELDGTTANALPYQRRRVGSGSLGQSEQWHILPAAPIIAPR